VISRELKKRVEKILDTLDTPDIDAFRKIDKLIESNYTTEKFIYLYYNNNITIPKN